MNHPLIIGDKQIYYPTLEYPEWKALNNSLSKGIIINVIDILNLLDYSHNKKSIIKSTKDAIYKYKLQELYWYISHIDNPFTYNFILDRVEHIDRQNKYYDSIEVPKEVKTKTKTKKRTKNKYYKNVVKNIFTGEIEYDYVNPITGDKISSKDPNLDKELNRKQKKQKVTSIPLDAMTFSFDI